MKDATYIVGFSGQARSGKDTLVQMLERIAPHFNVQTQRVAFAVPLKMIYKHAWAIKQHPYSAEISRGLLRNYLTTLSLAQQDEAIEWMLEQLIWSQEICETPYDDDNPVVKNLHRRNLISIGMHFRGISPNFWVDAAIAQIREDVDFAFISDVRFVNEAEAVDYVVRINRPGLVPIYKDGAIDTSEVFAITGDYDHMVQNNGGMGELVEQAFDLMITLLIERTKALVTG